MHLRLNAVLVLLCLSLAVSSANAQVEQTTSPATFEPAWTGALYEGDLTGARRQLLDVVREDPENSQALLGVAITRLLIGLEGLMQTAYRHGFGPDRSLARITPYGRLPVPRNPDPQTVAYDDVRIALKAWLSDLERTAADLSKIDDPDLKLPLHVGRIRLDFDGDGNASEQEALWKVYATSARMGGPGTEQADFQTAAEDFNIVFDQADVHWLRGYCHLIMAPTEIMLAHDWRELFERTGHLLFMKPETSYEFLLAETERRGWLTWRIADAIAWVHLLDVELIEPDRMASALSHLETVIGQSRASWAAINAETDDEREWIPGPDQTGVVPGVEISAEMVAAWHIFLDEAEALLAGEKLIPFWRPVAGDKGLNLRRVFTEPRGFDLVLWMQGTEAAPYLEEGSVTDGGTWRSLQSTFRDSFLGFALWFN